MSFSISLFILIEFLEEKNIRNLKNKLIILDNANSHRNELVKKLIDKDII